MGKERSVTYYTPYPLRLLPPILLALQALQIAQKLFLI
jgi:hypothetical protein